MRFHAILCPESYLEEAVLENGPSRVLVDKSGFLWTETCLHAHSPLETRSKNFVGARQFGDTFSGVDQDRRNKKKLAPRPSLKKRTTEKKRNMISGI